LRDDWFAIMSGFVRLIDIGLLGHYLE